MKKKEILSGVLITPKGNSSLPYTLNALEPYISEQTLYYHHGKHLETYLQNTKKLQQGTPFEGKCIMDTLLGAKDALYNNAAQAYNHIFYFEQFAPAESGKNIPVGKILTLIEESFGSYQNFMDEFTQAALSLFGSGWVWLTLSPNQELKIVKTPNAGNPILDMYAPLFVVDVWEHAYYIDQKNNRKGYLDNLWNIVDWDIISQRLENTLKTLSI